MSAAFSNLLTWLLQHYLEVVAVITGLVYVLYTIQEKNLLWLFGIISSGLYSWVFYQSGIYAYSLLYIYYVVIGFYGWYNWSKKSADSINHNEILHVHRASKGYLWRCIALVVIIAIPIYVILNKFTVFRYGA